MPRVLCVCRLSRHRGWREAVVDCARGIFSYLGAVHRLQRETLEGEAREGFGRGICLRVDPFELVTSPDHQSS